MACTTTLPVLNSLPKCVIPLVAAGRKKKQRHGETVIPPRSLFDRATPGMLKMRREGKEQKKNILLKQQTQFAKPLPTLVKPAMEAGQDNPEWLISEDWALLQVRRRCSACSAHGQIAHTVCRIGSTQERSAKPCISHV